VVCVVGVQEGEQVRGGVCRAAMVGQAEPGKRRQVCGRGREPMLLPAACAQVRCGGAEPGDKPKRDVQRGAGKTIESAAVKDMRRPCPGQQEQEEAEIVRGEL